jgi:hypothetical protein
MSGLRSTTRYEPRYRKIRHKKNLSSITNEERPSLLFVLLTITLRQIMKLNVKMNVNGFFSQK